MPHSPLISALAFVLASLVAVPASALTQLERMEELGEQAGALTNEALAMQIPALEGNLPDPAWDDTLREAFGCVLEGYLELSSPAAVDAMLDEMELALADTTAEDLLDGAFEDRENLPDGISPEVGQALMGNCGVMMIMMTRMAESGAMTIMMEQ